MSDNLICIFNFSSYSVIGFNDRFVCNSNPNSYTIYDFIQNKNCKKFSSRPHKWIKFTCYMSISILCGVFWKALADNEQCYITIPCVLVNWIHAKTDIYIARNKCHWQSLSGLEALTVFAHQLWGNFNMTANEMKCIREYTPENA